MMKSLYRVMPPRYIGYAGILIVCAAALSGCATTATTATTELPRARVTIDVDKGAGFTITEEARVSGSVRADYRAALNDLEQGRHEEGVALLEKVAAETPQLSAPRIDLGIAYRRAGDFEAAERNLLLAIETNPEHPAAHNELGIVYRATGRFSEARASYESALAIYPDYHYARRNLAVLCDLYLSDPACALENYEDYAALVPGENETSIWISDIRARHEQAAQ
jgi:Flp pilus assembly protein TadD